MLSPVQWNWLSGAAGTGMAVLASLQLVLTSAGTPPAVAQGEREDSRRSLISQGVPVGWRDGVPVADLSSVKVAQQPETGEPPAGSAGAQKVFEEAVQLRSQGTAESLKAAIEKFSEALSLFRAAGDKRGEAGTLNNIGLVYSDLGEKQKALDYISQALPLFRALGDRAREATTLTSIGAVYSDLGEKQKALDYYSQALPLYRAVGNRAREAVTLIGIGNVYSSSGEKQKALDYYSQALPLRRAAGDTGGEATTLYTIAILERNRGNLTEALTQIEASLKIVEDLRGKIDSEKLRASYFATVQERYQFYIDLLMRLHKQQPNSGYDAQALHASESARARTLLELLAEAGAADIRAGASPQLLQLERSLLQQINAVEQQRAKLLASNPPQQAQVASLEKQRDSLLRQYEEVRAQIRTKSPRDAALTQPQPLTLAEIQQQVLDESTLLLEYSLGEERSYLWAVTKTGITSYSLPPRADIEKAAKAFRDVLTLGESATPARLTAAGQALSDIILKPVSGMWGEKRLAVVSDGILQYIPFAALPAPGNNSDYIPIIQEREIVYLPSASALAILRRNTEQRQPAPKTLAVIADPVFSTDDERVRGIVASPELPVGGQQLQRAAAHAGVEMNRLPFTRVEAQQILSLVPEGQRLQALDFAANPATVTSSELSQYRIVHFATHGLANSESPELSGIVLSLVDEKGTLQNGYLRLNDIFNLNLPADLVVLSGGKTGLGAEIKGEGLVGLTRGFMYAGAPRVVVSLWSVNDKSPAELMGKFYHKMLKEGKPAAAALREAQLEMWKETQWKVPYYWAAFVLQGEWK